MRTALLLVVTLVLAACQAIRPTSVETQTDLLVPPTWVADNLDAPGVVVLHVGRDRTSYDAGHIPGARFLPLSAVAVDRDGQLNVFPPAAEMEAAFEAVGVSDESDVIVYGDMNGLAAARAFVALDVLGHPQVALLDGGLEGWKSAGEPVSTNAPPASTGTLTPSFRTELVVDADQVNRLRTGGSTVLVDARPPDQHSGEVPGEGVERPGHIPGSVNLFWEDDLQSDGRLRPIEELRTRWSEAGIRPGRTIVTYCRTGMQASFAYFVARYLGFEPLLYDGSFHDWSNNTDYPVAGP